VVGGDEIQYAWSGDVAIAYAVYGDGPHDLVFAHGGAGNIEIEREIPFMRAFQDACSKFSRFIVFDKRGTGLSDRLRAAASLETRMDDLRAVLDAVGSEHAVLFGSAGAASMCMLFAATYPERCLGLVLHNAWARLTWAPDYPLGETQEASRGEIDEAVRTWGTYASAEQMVRAVAPSHADDPEFVAAWARHLRLSASPGAIATIMRMAGDTDVRDILGAIRVPVLVSHLPAHREAAAYIAERIPRARLFENPGPDAAIYLTVDTLLPEVERFLAGLEAEESDTVLATVLFTDIVGSTQKLAELGDARWREVVERHHALVRAQLGRFRGRELDTAGDGFFAAFDGPMRAIRCAHAIGESLRGIGLEIRAGLHTGECEVIGDKLTGIAVHIGARLAAQARPGEVIVSSTVRDLVAGSDLRFDDRGATELKGVPGEWQVYVAEKA
jgi:class 3 adenylate cyclase